MKIRKISLQNIHSIRAETHIDFEEPPLAGCGLFAITGDTGAGKTTILDAMTLALYGRVCRSKEDADVLSHGASAGFAACEFEAQGARYLARWETRLTTSRNGTVTATKKRHLAKWDEDRREFLVTHSRLTEVSNQIEVITSLDFQRFTRSVLLAQGDFAAFLNADAGDRGILLEKITGQEIYASLSIAAYQRHVREKSQLSAMQARRDGISLLTREQEEELQARLQQAEQQCQVFQEELGSLRARRALLSHLEALERSRSQAEAAAAALAAERQTALPGLQRLDMHRKAAEFAPLLDRLEEETAKASLAAAETGRAATLLEALTTEEGLRDSALREAARQVQQKRAEQEDTFQLLQRVAALDQQILTQRKDLSLRQSQLDRLSADREAALALQYATRQRVSEIGRQLEQTESWLARHASLASLGAKINAISLLREQLQQQWRHLQELGKSTRQLRGEIEAGLASLEALSTQRKAVETIQLGLQDEIRRLAPGLEVNDTALLISQMNRAILESNRRLADFRQYQLHREAFESLTTRLLESRRALGELAAEASSLELELAASAKQTGELESNLGFRQAIYQQQQMLANYEKDRSLLKEGEPCPLCQSTHHPFREHGVEIYTDRAREEFEQASQALRAARESAERLRAKESEIRIKQAQIAGPGNARLLALEEQIGSCRRSMGELFPALAGAGFDGKAAAELEDAMQREENALPGKVRQRDAMELAIRSLGECNENLRSLEARAGAMEATLGQQRQLLKEREENQQAAGQKYEELVSTLDQLLLPHGCHFEVATAREMFDSLERQAGEYADALALKGQLEKNLEVEKTRLEQAARSAADLAVRTSELEAASQEDRRQLRRMEQERQELFAGKDPEAERKRFLQALELLEKEERERREGYLDIRNQLAAAGQALKEKQAQLVQGNMARDEALRSLVQRLAHTEFSGVDSLRESLIRQEEELRHLEAMSKALVEREQAIGSQLKHYAEQLAAAVPQVGEGWNLETTDDRIGQLEGSVLLLVEKVGALRHQLADNEHRRQGVSDLLQEIEGQQRTVNLWTTMNDLIGQHDGKKFRIFAQSLTLRRLVQMANTHLENLNGRYIIQKRAGNDLELEIVDTYQGNSCRPMGTLSGGEKFLVSLALAMGLSDLAGRKSSIGTLFIDEGFGTLDDEALDMAITTLENMHAGGKTIGLISHVKALKERIVSQVRVIKRGSGISVVEIPAG